VKQLVFQEQRIAGFKSYFQEEIKLSKTVNPEDADNKGNIERWMKDLEVKIKKTLRDITNECVKAYTKEVNI